MNLEDRLRESIEAGIQRLGRDLDEHVRVLMDELWRTAQEQREVAVEEARSAGARDAAETHAAEAAELHGTIRHQASELARLRAEADSRAADLVRLKGEADRYAAELTRARDEVDQRGTELTRLRDEMDRHSAELYRLRNEVGKQTVELARAEQHIADANQLRADAAQHSAQELARERAEAQRRMADAVDQAIAEADRKYGAEIERHKAEYGAEIERYRAETERLRAVAERPFYQSPGSAERELRRLGRLLAATQRLDAGGSISDILDALSDALTVEVGRFAIFLVNGGRAQPWRLGGFDDSLDARAFEMDARASDLVAHAVSAGEPFTGTGETAGLPVAPLPAGRSAVAVPISVGGRVVAVAYADDVTSRSDGISSGWAEVSEVLVRHAGRCLEAVTAVKTTKAVSLAG